MALGTYSSASYSMATGKTLISVKENDNSKNVFFMAEVEGDHSQATESELIRLALEWFQLEYIKTFSNQLLNDKINEVNKVILASQEHQAQLEKKMVEAEAERNRRFASLEVTIHQTVAELTELVMGSLTSDEEEESPELEEEDRDHETVIE